MHSSDALHPNEPRKTGVGISRIGLTALLISGCPEICSGPEVDRIYILPEALWVEEDSKFTVRVRLVSKHGIIFADDSAASVRWEAGPGLIISGSTQGPSVVVSATSAPATSTLKASFKSKTVTAPVRIHSRHPTSNNERWVAAEHLPGHKPAISLVSADALQDRVFGFVRSLPLTDLVCTDDGCGNVSLFSQSRGVMRSPNVTWGDKCVVDFSGASSLEPCDGVNDRIPADTRQLPFNSLYFLAPGVGTQPSQVTAMIQTDLAWLRQLLANNWTGLDVDASVEFGDDLFVKIDPGKSNPCDVDPSVHQQLMDAGVPSHAFSDNAIIVAYVSGFAGMQYWDGLFCPGTELGTVALIRWNSGVPRPTSLGHEIAHAAGPWRAAEKYGHVRNVPGFTASNILWENADAVGAPPTHISFGQAFRISLDQNSVFYRGSYDGAYPEGHADCRNPPSRCPAPAKDIVTP